MFCYIFVLDSPPPVFDVSYLCAGAVLGEVDISFLCTGAVLGEGRIVLAQAPAQLGPLSIVKHICFVIFFCHTPHRQLLMFHICAQTQYLVRFGAFSPRPQHNTIWKNIDMYICYSYRDRCFFLGWMFLHHDLQHIQILVFFCFSHFLYPNQMETSVFL